MLKKLLAPVYKGINIVFIWEQVVCDLVDYTEMDRCGGSKTIVLDDYFFHLP